jgi:transposase, IS5 family
MRAPRGMQGARYKLHANTDRRYKLIRRVKVTAANVDDGQTLKDVLDEANTGRSVKADRGYDSQANRDLLKDKGLRDDIARRAKPGQQARQRLDARNKTINRSRSRGEHVFAGLEQLGGKVVRAMRLARNELAILLKCAAYNAKRLVWLASKEPVPGAR